VLGEGSYVAANQLRTLVNFLRRISVPAWAAGQADSQLLKRFVDDDDPAAFAALVQRHGPLVFGVCQRVLHNTHDAEDAFQATFLLLARKCNSILKKDSIGSWLHGVAFKVATRAKTDRARRKEREGKVHPPGAAPDSLQDVVWRDLRVMLDDEVQRLPSRCREPFVLCYMEGKTNEEAARLLGCPTGTVLSRLAKAREILRRGGTPCLSEPFGWHAP
jgi:RNA polymerase sigma factor (sigma-70 family)